MVYPTDAMDSSIEAACLILEEIVEQISLKDAPSSNEGTSEKHQTESSRQCHGRTSPTIHSEEDESYSSEGSGDPSAFFRMYLKEQPSFGTLRPQDLPVANKMGHANLQALATWTLQELGRDTIPLEIEASNLLSQLSPPTATAHLQQLVATKNDGCKKRTLWRRKRREVKSRTQPLKMFGSEYARHLSGSELSPEASKISRSKATEQAHQSIVDLENADSATLAGALVDIVVTAAYQATPKGFYRISQTASGQSFVIPKKRGLVLNIKKETSWDKAAQRPCVTAITLVFPDRKEFVPPGFSVVKYKDEPADLGIEERVYICFRRSREGNPLTGLLPLSPSHCEHVPEGYAVVEKSPRNFPAVLSPGFFLAYRQRLASLETLRPKPLMNYIHQTSSQNDVFPQAYYCTGGTVVAADIGRFHAMDRSTHSLVSQGSIINRLKVIENSRQKSKDDSTLFQASTVSTASFTYDGQSENSPSNHTPVPLSFSSDVRCTSFDAGLLTLLSQKSKDISPSPDSKDQLDFIPRVTVVNSDGDDRFLAEKLDNRVNVLLPILTACYSRHGGTPLVAVEGLHLLLKETELFGDDIDQSKEPIDNESSTRLTLLDVAVQAVCDVATTGAQEVTFAACVDFVQKAIQLAGGRLNSRTIGFVVRFYIFIFQFEATIPSRSTSWPNPAWSFQKVEGLALLHDPRQERDKYSYLPGGAPQMAVLGLKELISLSLHRVHQSVSLDPDSGHESDDSSSVFQGLSGSDGQDVDIASLMQLALHQIHRTVGSELFWYDMIHIVGQGLFPKVDSITDGTRDIFIMAFAILSTLVKLASGPLRPNTQKGKELHSRDTACKLLALELVSHYLERWTMAYEMYGFEKDAVLPEYIERFGYCIRRFVVPCLLQNTDSAMGAPLVFSRIIRIISDLWLSPFYRSRCKVEIGILIEHFAIHFLRLKTDDLLSGESSACCFLTQKSAIVKEIRKWFTEDPKDAIEMYLNYDVHLQDGDDRRLQGMNLNIFTRLCAALSELTEECGVVMKNAARTVSEPEGKPKPLFQNLVSKGLVQQIDQVAVDRVRELRKYTIEAIAQITKCLAIAVAFGRGRGHGMLILSWSGAHCPVSYDSSLSSSSSGDSPGCDFRESSSCKTNTNVDFRRNISVTIRDSDSDNILSKTRYLDAATDIAEQKSLRKAIEYLVACKVVPSSPRDIVGYLRLHEQSFSPRALGVFLGESGSSPAERDYFDSIRYFYVKSDSFVGVPVESALRRFLTKSGFRLPHEAQMIDRIISTFASCFFEDNAGDPSCCPFANEATVYVLCFAIILLNTDLHKMNDEPKAKDRAMSKEDFIKNFRGVEGGEEVPRDYLGAIYNSIRGNPIATEVSLDVGDRESETRRHLLDNARAADTLLRGLAVQQYHFQTVEEFNENLTTGQSFLGVTRDCSSGIWHHLHGVVNTGMETTNLDPGSIAAMFEVLLYSLSTAFCLNMRTQLSVFLDQVGRLKGHEETRQGQWGIPEPNLPPSSEQWHKEATLASTFDCSSSSLSVLSKTHKILQTLKRAVLESATNKYGMIKAVERLSSADYLYLDPRRIFLKSARLIKRSMSTRRSSPCWFFLFSDLLVYAKEEDSRCGLKIHDEFPLNLIKIVDWFPSANRDHPRRFDVHHPRKSFQIICPSKEDKDEWVAAIRCTQPTRHGRRVHSPLPGMPPTV